MHYTKAVFTSRLFVVVAEDDQTEVHDDLIFGDGGFMLFTSKEAAEEMIEHLRVDLLEKKWVVITLQEYMDAVHRSIWMQYKRSSIARGMKQEETK